ncbi:hypothetical protein HN51_032254 [Arachis hypogaea]|uniref:DNA repair metallo-beta-lactamase domain-containing protein n=1 Tax=Arachis hypogaea TaxID=3818 RepID=A0A445B551_ARAHY|nr:protein artemis-like [Arachis hypogaea]QHO16561.1 5' exonuclease Apollo [Arachis hypogaea]RYR33781.1 hypothetical protein Ahy_A10g048414 [Arachis hypogaea]
MPIEMPRGLPFSVDTWSPSSMASKRHHFLSHAHRDHSSGISSYFSIPIYSTLLTKNLLLRHFPHLQPHAASFFTIEVGQSLTLDDPSGPFTVTAFDANHCPGAVMLLFEGKFGNILHTGDCRLTPECVRNLPAKYVGKKGKPPPCALDCVFLDCTFGSFSQAMPSKNSAVQQVVNCIWKHPDALTVYLICDMLGQEEILLSVSKTFGSKIYVDRAENPDCFKNLELTAPEILCEDRLCRFHLFDGSPGLYERAKAKLLEAKAALQPEPLFVRPSSQWYAIEEGFSDIENARKRRISEAVVDQFGVWHVCYSMHSSKEELEWALQLLAPKWVVSTTPSCRAMELDYVKKHCFKSKAALSSSIWKLLDINVEASEDADAFMKSVSCSPVVEETPQPFARIESPVKQRTDTIKLVSLPAQRLPVTLFGRARLSLQDSSFSRVGCNSLPTNVPTQAISSNAGKEVLDGRKDAEAKLGRSPERKDLRQVKYQPSEDQEIRDLHQVKYQQSDDQESEVQEIIDLHQVKYQQSGDQESEVQEIIDLPQVKYQQSDDQESEVQEIIDLHQVKYQQSEDQESEVKEIRVNNSRSYLNIRPSGMSDSVRKLYRRMNVPVPEPLPSLVKLMNSNKRAKRGIF